MAARRVLLVDDNRDVTRPLRLALEGLGPDIVIIEVQSGEEAILELGRGAVDMMICNVKLPDMSGLDVLKRARRVNSGAYTVMMGPPEDTKSQQYAQAMGATTFLKHPVNVSNFMPEAQKALGVSAAPVKRPTGPLPPPAEQPATINDRLSTLRRDLGANAVYLVDKHGRVIMTSGESPKLDTAAVFKHLVEAFVSAMKVCQLLGGFIPSNVHFFDGDDFDLYAANVGQYYSLAIVFDGDRGAGQMGPVMRYGRQCADDLLNSLVMMGDSSDANAAPSIASVAPALAPSITPSITPKSSSSPAKSAPLAAKPTAAAHEGESPLALARRMAATKTSAPPPPKAPVMEERVIEPTLKPLSDDEFAKLTAALGQGAPPAAKADPNSFWDAATSDQPPAPAATPSADAASFWDTAVAEEEKKDDPKTLSLEEAAKLGLIPKK